jgi:hypothetical protein
VPVASPVAVVTDVTPSTAKVNMALTNAGCTITSFDVKVTAPGGVPVTLPRTRTIGNPSRGQVVFDITNMSPGTVYNVEIIGYCGNGTQAPVSTRLTVQTPGDRSDSMPTVSFSDIGTNSVVISIAPPRAGCTPSSYQIRQASINEKPKMFTVKGSSVTYNLTGLIPGRSYSISAIGVCSDGISKTSASEIRNFTTKAIPPVVVDFTIRTNGTTLDQFTDKVVADICEQLLSTVKNYPRGEFDNPVSAVVWTFCFVSNNHLG